MIQFWRAYLSDELVETTTEFFNTLPKFNSKRPWKMMGKEDDSFPDLGWSIFRGELLNFQWGTI